MGYGWAWVQDNHPWGWNITFKLGKVGKSHSKHQKDPEYSRDCTLDWDILIQFLAILYSPGWKNEPYFSSHQACVFSEQGHHAGMPLSSAGAGHLWKAMARIDLNAQHEYFLRELLRLCSNSQIWNLSFQTQPALGFSGVIWRAVFFRAVMEGSLEVDTFYKYSYLAKSPFFH